MKARLTFIKVPSFPFSNKISVGLPLPHPSNQHFSRWQSLWLHKSLKEWTHVQIRISRTPEENSTSQQSVCSGNASAPFSALLWNCMQLFVKPVTEIMITFCNAPATEDFLCHTLMTDTFLIPAIWNCGLCPQLFWNHFSFHQIVFRNNPGKWKELYLHKANGGDVNICFVI